MSSTEEQLFEVRNSPIAGSGAFALRHIPKGTRLIEYTGERVSHKVADARYDEAEENGSSHVVLFTVDDRTVIDAGVGGNDARFINHSCAPNCEAVIVSKRVFIDAIRDIEPGQELAYDYEMQNDGEDAETARKFWPCRCGAPNCRGTLLLLPVEKPKRKAARRKPARKVKAKPTRRAASRKPARRKAPAKRKAKAPSRVARSKPKAPRRTRR